MLALLFGKNIALTLRHIVTDGELEEQGWRRFRKAFDATEKQYRKNKGGHINKWDNEAASGYAARTYKNHDLF
jgi:hypothetical protein